MNTQIIERFINENREELAPFASSVLFFLWASVALKQGTEPEVIFYQIMKFNIKGE